MLNVGVRKEVGLRVSRQWMFWVSQDIRVSSSSF